jgi:hypothetical protein
MQRLVVLLALVAGCAGMNESTRGEPVPADSPVADAPVAPTQLSIAEDIEAEPVVPSPSAEVERPAAAGPSPPVLAPAKAATSAVPVAVAKLPPRKQDDPVAAVAPVAALLDVAALRARLRETAAIGILAKISLRRKVDDLLESFRSHYDGGQRTSLAALRRPYDELIMKVLDMLQDGDPSLARSISGSREAIWEILSDRERFRSMN